MTSHIPISLAALFSLCCGCCCRWVRVRHHRMSVCVRVHVSYLVFFWWLQTDCMRELSSRTSVQSNSILAYMSPSKRTNSSQPYGTSMVLSGRRRVYASLGMETTDGRPWAASFPGDGGRDSSLLTGTRNAVCKSTGSVVRESGTQATATRYPTLSGRA
jgi:hypothetical protein